MSRGGSCSRWTTYVVVEIESVLFMKKYRKLNIVEAIRDGGLATGTSKLRNRKEKALVLLLLYAYDRATPRRQKRYQIEF